MLSCCVALAPSGGRKPSIEVDASAVISADDLSDAWGSDRRTSVGPGCGEPWKFGAQWGDYTDQEAGLVLLTRRYYEPPDGRLLPARNRCQRAHEGTLRGRAP